MLHFLLLITGIIVSYVYGFRWLDTYKSTTDEKEKQKALIYAILLLIAGSVCAIVLLVISIGTLYLVNFNPSYLLGLKKLPQPPSSINTATGSQISPPNNTPK